MKQDGFTASTFVSWWFLIYMAIRMIGTIGQLYIFSNTEVGKTLALFGAFSLILVNIGGVLFLGEVLPLKAYVGVMLAIAAVVVLALTKQNA